MNEYHKNTCIRFVPRTNERDYVEIRNEVNPAYTGYLSIRPFYVKNLFIRDGINYIMKMLLRPTRSPRGGKLAFLGRNMSLFTWRQLWLLGSVCCTTRTDARNGFLPWTESLRQRRLCYRQLYQYSAWYSKSINIFGDLVSINYYFMLF